MPKNKPSLHLSKKNYQKLLQIKSEKIQSFKNKMDKNRIWSDKLADLFTNSFGTIWFLIINVTWFIGWIIINTGLIPGINPFDPFPFGLLTMVVSLEAIFLSIIVLISQNRASKIADLREEIDLHINIKAEHEITKILHILDEIHDHMGLPPEDDAELTFMKQKTNLRVIENTLEKELKENE